MNAKFINGVKITNPNSAGILVEQDKTFKLISKRIAIAICRTLGDGEGEVYSLSSQYELFFSRDLNVVSVLVNGEELKRDFESFHITNNGYLGKELNINLKGRVNNFKDTVEITITIVDYKNKTFTDYIYQV